MDARFTPQQGMRLRTPLWNVLPDKVAYPPPGAVVENAAFYAMH
jgi:hypothetical protein